MQRIVIAIAATLLFASSTTAQECGKTYDSTFEMIQEAIFEGRGCTNLNCHASTNPAGGLDLSADVAWDNLIDQSGQTLPPDQGESMRRVSPLSATRSLLWINLAAATLPEQWQAPIRPMPTGGVAPLTLDELDVVRLWIEGGAPRDGVVPGTADLLDACLPDPKPIKVPPLPVPEPGVGVQVTAPTQVLPPNSEDEVCFISYFDLTDQVPERFRSPDGEKFRYKRAEYRRDPLSHHTVVNIYRGATPIDDPAWGEFTCKQGERHGESCDPTDLAFCGEGKCSSPPETAVACTGYGPGDASIGTATEGLFSSMATSATVPGLYLEAPLRGIIIWNSHHFNATDEAGELDIYINLFFAEPEEQERLLMRDNDASGIFKMRVPPFAAQEVCGRWVAPPDVDMLTISSHMHQRGSRFRTFLGNFQCVGGPNDGDACSPLDPGLPVADLCEGGACIGFEPPSMGDCDEDSRIRINDLVTGVTIALGRQTLDDCPRFDSNGDGSISVAELVAAVRILLSPTTIDGEERLEYVNFSYVDPVIERYDPPLQLGGADVHPGNRTFTFCALYDNGLTDPDRVKRFSENPPLSFFGCRQPTHCFLGLVGEACSGEDLDARHRSCDTTPGAGDGLCDACLLRGGVTTEDEMFIFSNTFAETLSP